MSKNGKKWIALSAVAVMAFSVTAAAGEASTEQESTESRENLVFATSTFGQKFSPFFATTAYDMQVVDLTQQSALAADRGGAIIEHGIEGETINYNGTDYTYYGMGDVTVTQNDDGTVDYTIHIRDDQKFSDGEPVTIDDYIFSFYVLCDPTYDRRIIYSTEHAEARIRERRKGDAEIVVFIWSDTNEKGTRVIREYIPELETFAQRKAYLKRVARYVEKLNTKMSAVDDCIENMRDAIW